MAKVIILNSNTEYYKSFSSESTRADRKFHILTEHISSVEELNRNHSIVHVGPNSFHVTENVDEIFKQMWN